MIGKIQMSKQIIHSIDFNFLYIKLRNLEKVYLIKSLIKFF